ncbi:MAG: hypothetical protein WD036_05285 [Bauldia sp.]
MAARTIAEEGRGRAWAAATPFLVAAVVYLVALAVGAALLNDPDTYWHLVVGGWILNNGFPTGDPFSFTFAGEPWIAKEWLSQVLFVLAHRAGGWTAVVVLSAGAIALAFALLTRLLLAELAPLPVLTLVAAAFLLAAPHLVARPHVLALPVAVAWVGGLVRAVDRGKPPPYALLPLMVLWANLHGAFTLGILLAGAAGLDAIVAAGPGERLRLAFRWLGFCALALAACTITPYGPESMVVTYRVLSLGPALSIISEWRPADFGHFAGFEAVLLAALGLALLYGVVVHPLRIVVVLGLLHLALSAARNADFLGLLAPLFLAAPLGRQFPALRADAAPAAGARSMATLAFGLLVVLVPATAVLAWVNGYQPSRRISPEAAVEAIRRAAPGAVLNDYDFGGYLIYSRIAPFIDGRAELYGGTFTARHHRAVTLSDLDDFLLILDAYKIGATLLTPRTPAVMLLDQLPGWTRLYGDDVAVVHVRVAPELRDAR